MTNQEKISRLLQIMMNKSVLNPEARKEIEEILGESGQISSISELICDFVDKAPYLSRDQKDSLRSDLREIFGRLDAGDGRTSLSDKIKALKEEVRLGKFTFEREGIPLDAAKPRQKEMEDLIKWVIEDIFGTLINNLPPDDKLRKRVQVDQAIERAVQDFLVID